MKYALIFITSFFLFSCELDFSKMVGSNKAKVPIHSVIYLDNYFADFLKAANMDYINRNKIFSEKMDALTRDHFLKSEYYDIVSRSFQYSIQDTSGFTKSISDLKSNRSQVETLISSASFVCNQHLKNDSIKFYIVPLNPNIKEVINIMGGVTGQTAGSKQILLTIDFDNSSWKETLEYAVAHEFNHACWTNSNFNSLFKWTLLNYIIFEGKADSFAHLLYPKVKAPWTSFLSDKEKMDLWSKIKPNLQSSDPNLLGEVMFGSKNYPRWGGYALGYEILQAAFKNHPSILETNWTNLETVKLLELSDYN